MPRPVNRSTSDALEHAGAQHFRTGDGDDAYVGDRPNVTDGETNERIFPGQIYDELYLSPEDLKDYGIPTAIPSSLADTDMPGDLVYIAPRAPAVYGKTAPGDMRLKKTRWKTFRYLTDEDGNPRYATSDTVFAVVSRDEYLGKTAKHNEKSYRFTKGVIEAAVESAESEDGIIRDFRAGDENFLRKKVKEASARLAGMRSGYPNTMSLETIEAEVERGNPGAIKRLERKYARGGRAERPGEYEEFEARMAEAQKKSRESPKMISVPK